MIVELGPVSAADSRQLVEDFRRPFGAPGGDRMGDFEVNDVGELRAARERIAELEDRVATLREHLASSRRVAGRALADVRRLDAVACAAHRDTGKSEATRAALRRLLNGGYILQDGRPTVGAAECYEDCARCTECDRGIGRPHTPACSMPGPAARALARAGREPSESETANRIRLRVLHQGPSVDAFAEAVADEIDALRDRWIAELRAHASRRSASGPPPPAIPDDLEEGVPAFEPVELGGDKVGPHDTIGDVFPRGLTVRDHDPVRGCDGCPMLSHGFDGPGCTALGLRLLEVDSRSGSPVAPQRCPLLRGRAIVVQGADRG